MTAATSINSSEARVLAVASLASTPDINLSQSRVMAAANIPAPSINASEARVFAAVRDPAIIEVDQARILAVVRGHVEDPAVRAWTFTLDGHDYYVLHLGETETLVYDALSEQWYNWGSDNFKYWRALVGCNWIDGAAVAAPYGSSIVVGDYVHGSLYFLNADSDIDDDPLSGSSVPHTFERIIQGQVAMKGYNSRRCYGIELLGSAGDMDPSSSTTVKLEYSDDRGNSYVDAGTVNLTNGDYSARIDWRSLGSMSAPGRLFRITDYGALRRIDSLDMADDKGPI